MPAGRGAGGEALTLTSSSAPGLVSGLSQPIPSKVLDRCGRDQDRRHESQILGPRPLTGMGFFPAALSSVERARVHVGPLGQPTKLRRMLLIKEHVHAIRGRISCS